MDVGAVKAPTICPIDWPLWSLPDAEVPNQSVTPTIRVDVFDGIDRNQFGQEGDQLHRVARKQPHFQCDGLPLKHAVVIGFGPDADQQESRAERHADERLVGEQTGMD